MAPKAVELYWPDVHAVQNEGADEAVNELYEPTAQATHAEGADAVASTL